MENEWLPIGVVWCGRVVVWSCGRVVVWLCFRVVVWSCGRVVVWYGRVGVAIAGAFGVGSGESGQVSESPGHVRDCGSAWRRGRTVDSVQWTANSEQRTAA